MMTLDMFIERLKYWTGAASVSWRTAGGELRTNRPVPHHLRGTAREGCRL